MVCPIWGVSVILLFIILIIVNYNFVSFLSQHIRGQEDPGLHH